MDNCFQIGNYVLSRHIQLQKDNAKLVVVMLGAQMNKSESTGVYPTFGQISSVPVPCEGMTNPINSHIQMTQGKEVLYTC